MVSSIFVPTHNTFQTTVKLKGFSERSKPNNVLYIEAINIKTRQYAKRQVTWSRGHMTDWKREYTNSFSELSKKILKHLS